MGSFLDEKYIIAVNQDSQRAEECTNHFNNNALMEGNLLVNIYMINSKQDEDKEMFLDCESINC
jgi:hypothetical protein